MSAFFFPFSICRVPLTFPATLKTFLLFVTVDMLSRFQSTVNCRGRNVEGNFTNKVNCRYSCHFTGLDLCSYLKAQRAGLLKEEKMVELLIQSTS